MSDYRVAGKCWTPGAHPLFTATPNLLDREPGPNGYTTPHSVVVVDDRAIVSYPERGGLILHDLMAHN